MPRVLADQEVVWYLLFKIKTAMEVIFIIKL